MYETVNFIGLGSNYEDSLKKFGIVCRNDTSDQYYCIYKIGESYDEGFVSESEIRDLLTGKSWISEETISSFKNELDIDDINELFELPFIQILHRVVKYFGAEEIFGKSFSPMTFEEALNIVEND